MRKNNPVTKTMLKIIGDEKKQSITIPLLAILISLIVGAIIIIMMGKNPMTAYQNLLQGSGILPKPKYAGGKSMLTDFTSFMLSWTPMIFASLSVMVAMKAGLFNIGVSGQMLIAGFMATITVGYSTMSAEIARPLALLIGIVVGALVGGLVGFLKYKFNINEVVSTIMLNYIGQYIISFFITVNFIHPVSRQSNPVSDSSRWALMNTEINGLKMDIPLGIVLAIITAIVVHFIIKKTVFGYELKSVGQNPHSAKYAGINVGRTMVLAMVFSGGLAGVSGIMQYLGLYNSIQPRVLSSIGFDSIAVSLLANNNAIGIIFSSFLITIISKGSTYMSSTSGLEAEIASVITGIILLFSACGTMIKQKVNVLREVYGMKENVKVDTEDDNHKEEIKVEKETNEQAEERGEN